MSDQIEMALFVARYITCLIIFVLGLKAPGIMQNVDYFGLNDASNIQLVSLLFDNENVKIKVQCLFFQERIGAICVKI